MRYDDDNLPLDEVGEWASEKHDRLRKYIDASRAARRKFVEGTGGATYIDLYCGSGRAIVRETGMLIDGSPLVAFRSARDGGVPFSEVHLADVSEPSVEAARQRIAKAGGVAKPHVGRAEATVTSIVRELNPYGLHFALLDPYNLQDLPFSVIRTLSRMQRIDLLIHVSAQDLQRNLGSYLQEGDTRLEQFAPGWRDHVDVRQSRPAVRAAFLSYWASKIEELGLPPAKRAELVSGTTKNQRLYWLVFVSRSDFAKRLWEEIRTLSGQRTLL